MRFKYIDLPTVPNELIFHSEDEIATLENIFKFKDYPFYKQYVVPNKALKDYIESIFNCQCFCTYQVIKQGIKVHKDIGREDCYNYLIQTGGDNASLNLYDEDLVLIQKEFIPASKWHWLDVTKFHGVDGLTSTRISLSVVKK